MTGKGLRFVIYDKKDDMIATIPFDKELLNPKSMLIQIEHSILI